MRRDREYWENRLAKNVLELRHILTELNALDPSAESRMAEIFKEQGKMTFSPVDVWTGYVCVKLESSGRLVK